MCKFFANYYFSEKMNDPRVELQNQLSTRLASYGFQELPSVSQFRRTTETGFHNVVLSVGKAQPVIAELQLGIRLDIVERLAYQFTTGLSDYGSHSTTLLVSTGHLLGQPYQRYVIEDPTEVAAVARAMSNAVESVGLDFFHRYNSIVALDELYNGGNSRWVPHLVHRSLRGIILAKLAQRADWSTLVVNYRAQLQQRGTPEMLMDRYERLAAYLHHFSVN